MGKGLVKAVALQKCKQSLRRIDQACRDGRPTNRLWAGYRRAEALLTDAEVRKVSKYAERFF